MSIHDKQDFIKWEAATRDTIDVKRIYIDICNDLVCGVMVSQLLYYFLPVKEDNGNYRKHSKIVLVDGEEWVPMNRAEWWSACRISERQVDNCLTNIGIKAERGGELQVPKGDSKSLVVYRTTFIEKNSKRIVILRPNWPVFLDALNRFSANYESGRREFSRDSEIEFHPTTNGENPEITENVISIFGPSHPDAKLQNSTLRNDENGYIENLKNGISKLPFSLNPNDKEVLKEDKKEQHQHHSASPNHGGAGEFSIENEKPAAPVGAPTANRKKRKRDFVPSIESLDEERRAVAVSLINHPTAPVDLGPAVQLASILAPELIRKQIEWLPFSIQDQIDAGKDVVNESGLLVYNIKNQAARPKSYQRAERSQLDAQAEAERQRLESLQTEQANAVWATLTDPQRRALDEDVLAKFRREFGNEMLTVKSGGYAKRRRAALLDPALKEKMAALLPAAGKATTDVQAVKVSELTLQNLEVNPDFAPLFAQFADSGDFAPLDAKLQSRFSAGERKYIEAQFRKAIEGNRETAKPATYQPDKKRLPALSRLITKFRFDIEDDSLTLSEMAVQLRDDDELNDDERGYIQSAVKTQLGTLQKAA